MSYALIEDIAASWERYEPIADSLERMPDGLLLHVAGPTDEGFRIIEVWESESAWQHAAGDRAVALDGDKGTAVTRTIVRGLEVAHLVLGMASTGHRPSMKEDPRRRLPGQQR